jgi:hypothetical protein
VRRRNTVISISMPLAVLIIVVVGYAATTASKPPAAGATATVPIATGDALRQVHSPGRVAVDEQLHAGQCHVRIRDAGEGLVLPDAACTPGAVDPGVTQANIHQTICVHGYTATVRPPQSDTGPAKHESLGDYGLSYQPTTEYDHLVPLELGGTNAVSNLWPEPNASAARGFNNPKDQVENTLAAAVCDGRVPLAAAQHAIAADWTTATASLGL